MPRSPRVFISRTTAGLAALAERVAAVLRLRGIEPIIQTGFYPSTHDVKGMLAEHLQQCDAVICLIGTAYGSGPHDPITKAEQPVHGLKDPRTKNRLFSYTQLELLIARDLGRPIYTFFIEGDELVTAFGPEPTELAQRQQTFITEFAKGSATNTYRTFSQWDQPADPTRGLKQTIEAIKIEITVLAGKPTNLPYTSLGTLFKGRDEFLAELRQHLTAEGPVVIKGKRTIHGMGGVGKTRAAIEYAWKHADGYRALLFISADTPEALHRNLAALCGPLVLNLREQNEKEQALQVEAALRWLKLNPGWFLIIDNVDTDEAAEETKALLSKLTTGHVLITSRISDWTGHVKSLDLDVLSEAASIAFLDERTEERRPKRDDDREQVAAMVKLLDCLALALEQAGAHISTTVISYADYIALWESHRSDALAWHDEEKMKYPKSIAITYQTSFTQLHSEAKQLYQVFSWFAPDPIPRSLLDLIENPVDVSACLRDILHFRLAQFTADGKSFTIHRLNQEITRQQQEDAMPEGLVIALKWLDNQLPLDLDDVRTWPVAVPLIPHAVASAKSGIACHLLSPSGELLNQAALFLTARADYENAESLCRKALDSAEETERAGGHFHATCLSNLAEVLRATGCLSEAEIVARRAIDIWDSLEAGDESQIASSKNNLALILLALDRFTEAEVFLEEALTIWEKSPDDSHAPISRGLGNLGHLLQSTNRSTEAESVLRKAITISEKHFGNSHPNTSNILINLAEVLRDTNRHTEAEQALRKALAIVESCYGNKHPTVASCLNNLGELLVTLDRTREAEPLLRRSSEIFEYCYGENHSSVAIALNNLALLLKAENRLQEAEVLFRKALAINESSFGPDHSFVARSLINLSTLLQLTNCITEAEAATRRALSIMEHCFGPAHPKTATAINNLAQILKSTGRLDEAEPLMQRALVIDETGLGSAHPNTARNLNNLAALFAATNRAESAESLMRRALAIYETSFGSDHPDVTLTLNNLGLLLASTGRQEEAEQLFRRALSITDKGDGANHPYFPSILNNLAEVLRERKSFAEAEVLMKRSLAIDEATFGNDHPGLATSLNNLALIFQATNRAAEAETLMRRAVDLLLKFTSKTGFQHPNLVPTYNNYSRLLAEIGDTEDQAMNRLRSILKPYGVDL